MHMHDVLRGLGITFHELGHRGIEAAIAILKDEGLTREEASTEIGHRRRRGALASLETQGFTGEGGARSASTELGHRGLGGALASLETQGFTGEGGTATASTELGRRGAVERWGKKEARINMKSGSCIYPGCPLSIRSGEFCKKHQPHKPIVEKSDKCRSCGQVLGVNVKVIGGVCRSCYDRPEATAARKKATAAKKAARGTCSTPGCDGVNNRGLGKCQTCLRHRKSK